ncbi:restriction endonuclease subunit S [Cylindrospermopsis raciborskii]|uniref:Restriction endonuclease n=1 Tax=Cylindrospermopsis raciborskii CS-505 TaxID=533240 RepID=A0A853MBW0_9CYAN|nr:restriction endonuclease subunit S [Cylindrospermopsis raciborskii]EFA68245.1 Restriction modification system DNA specificity domain protein [Cylindrospermopsis raciborskii CS-505]OBU74816.1 restriction endonuclease [Cylindrospermopsis raciborskii CS-505]
MSEVALKQESEIVKGWKRYPAYKDSGVEWLGKIPEHWEVRKVSHAFQKIGSGTTPSTNHYDYYEGNIPWVNTSELREKVITDTSAKLTNKALLDHSVLNLYPPGTLLIAMYGATIGRLGILGITACTNQACCALANPISINAKFAFYWLWMRRNELILLSSGGGQPNINQEKIRSIRIPAPPLTEQQAIAQFLDRETAKIDTLVAKKERLIELLKEKRTALISHAVTKGLNPDAPMKDSGVEWLGEVPRNWPMIRLKHVAPVSSAKLTQKPDNLPYIGLEHIESKTGRLLLDTPVENVESTVSCFEKGDVLFGKLRPYLAKVLLAEFEGVSTTELLALKPSQDVNGKFLFFQLIAEGFIDQVNSFTYGTKMPRVGPEQITNLFIPLPPLPEQQAIAQFLDRETAKIDTLVAKTRTSIEKLKEYRTALISAAVTGKIDVREEVPIQ